MRTAAIVGAALIAIAVGALLSGRHLQNCQQAGREDCSFLPWSGGTAEVAPTAPCANAIPAARLAAVRTATRAVPARDQRTTPFSIGLGMRIWPVNDARAAAVVNPRVGRFDVEVDERRASIVECFELYRDLGMTPQPLVSFVRVPDARQVRHMAAWIKELAPHGLELVEFGNEDSYTYKYRDEPGDASYGERAEAYARAVRSLAEAIRGTGVGLLVQGDPAGLDSSEWIDRMYAAVPGLQRYVAGWTIHPYGPEYAARLDQAVAQVSAHGGGDRRFYVTEWGLATDDGRALNDNYGWPTNLTYQQSADLLQRFVDHLVSSGRVAQFIYFQSTDRRPSGTTNERENYFGVVQADGSTPKGALTAKVQQLLAAHP